MDDTEKKEPSKKDTAIGCLALIVIATALIFLLKGCFGGDDTKTVTIDWHASEGTDQPTGVAVQDGAEGNQSHKC